MTDGEKIASWLSKLKTPNEDDMLTNMKTSDNTNRGVLGEDEAVESTEAVVAGESIQPIDAIDAIDAIDSMEVNIPLELAEIIETADSEYEDEDEDANVNETERHVSSGDDLDSLGSTW